MDQTLLDQSLLQSVREATLQQHRALEAQPLLRTLLSPQVSQADYRQLLSALWVFYHNLEAWLLPIAEQLIARYPGDYSYIPRAPLLAADLQQLGVAPPTTASIDNGWMADSEDGFALGVLYVLEGATQGGKIIAPHLAQRLGLNGENGASFYNFHRCHLTWLPFRRWCVRCQAHYNEQSLLTHSIAGASATFTGLQTHLNQWQDR